MRFDELTALSFGGLEKGDRLDFKPGMNVIYGPNEAGKSTWHAALFAALCGQRRGRGRPEKPMFAKYRPWSGDEWKVKIQLTLEGGRRVEIRQELAEKVDCGAVDLVYGDDISSEILHDGGPDGAVWIGLDRDTFRAVACVEQADILAVRSSATALQDHMQRAAAATEGDATAASALVALEAYRAEKVTTDQSRTKPLQRARELVRERERELEDARRRHEEYLQLMEEVDRLHEESKKKSEERRRVEGRIAATETAELQKRLDKARDIIARQGEKEPPAELADAAVEREVREALGAWQSAPVVAEPAVPPRAELENVLQRLPDVGDGDMAVDASVSTAENGRVGAHGALQSHLRDAPPAAEDPVPEPSLDVERMRSLAGELERAVPELDPAAEARLASAQRRHADAQGSRRGGQPALLVVAGIAALAAVALVAIGQVVVGAIVAAVAAVLGLAWVLGRTRDDRVASSDELRQAEAAAAPARWQRADVLANQDAARAELEAAGLPLDPRALRDLADGAERRQRQAEDRHQWRQRRARLEGDLDKARDALLAAIAARGERLPGDLPADGAFGWYEARCAARATRAARNSDLEARRMYDAAVERRLDAGETLLALVAKLGLPVERPDDAARWLAEWQRDYRARAADLERQKQAWSQLQGLLGGQPIETLEQEVARRKSEVGGMDDVDASGNENLESLRARSRTLKAEEPAAQEAYISARKEADLAEKDLPSPSEAEEALAAATEELGRIERLGTTLQYTIDFLRAAQEQVHRDLAPRLGSTVTGWLPLVTRGRYVEAMVQPADLAVRVRTAGGEVREADGLSHGTREQVYLLLRFALARLLVKRGECAPLILDDITVQSDRARSEALLETLHTVSAENQVILFTQEEDVRDWARKTLSGDRDQFRELGPGLIPA